MPTAGKRPCHLSPPPPLSENVTVLCWRVPGTNITLKRFCLRARWTAVQRDSRFPPVLELLRERGFMAPNATEECVYDLVV